MKVFGKSSVFVSQTNSFAAYSPRCEVHRGTKRAVCVSPLYVDDFTICIKLCLRYLIKSWDNWQVKKLGAGAGDEVSENKSVIRRGYNP